jgi:excisionase family DNA binding protein
MDTMRLLVSVTDAAKALGVSRSLMYELVSRAEIQSVKIGKCRRIPVQAREAFITERLAPDLESVVVPEMSRARRTLR